MALKEPGLRGSLRNTGSVTPAFFDVTITNTNSPVQEGDILTVDYSADNTGDAQDMQDIRLEIDSVQEDVDSDVMLSGGASTTGTLEWDTTGEAEAEYTATVLSDDDSDSVIVEIGSAIPDSDLYYRIDEGSGDSIADSQGDNDADSRGSLVWVEDSDAAHGFYVELDGSNALEIQDADIIGRNSDFSIGIEIVVDTSLQNDTVLFEWNDNDQVFAVGVENDKIATTTFNFNDSEHIAGTPAHPEPSAPYSVDLVLTYDSENENAELYLDESASTESQAATSATGTADTTFVIGDSDEQDGRDMDGEGVARFAVWEDEVIDPDEFTL